MIILCCFLFLFLDVFFLIFTNRRLCVVIRWWWYLRENTPLVKFMGPKASIFWAKIQTPPSLDSLCAEARMNSGKTKTTGITRLPPHPRLVKFGSGHLSYRGLISCGFWPMAHGAVLQSRAWNVMEWLYLHRVQKKTFTFVFLHNS